jgi:hypothetical protein
MVTWYEMQKRRDDASGVFSESAQRLYQPTIRGVQIVKSESVVISGVSTVSAVQCSWVFEELSLGNSHRKKSAGEDSGSGREDFEWTSVVRLGASSETWSVL